MQKELKKYGRVYEGKMDLESFFAFLITNSTLKNRPMPKDKIKVIENALIGGKKLPKQYEIFLRNAGLKFEQWINSSYILVTEEDGLIDFGEDIMNNQKLYESFRLYGFELENCFFFLRKQENAYAFFLLNEEKEDPSVYFVCDSDARTVRESTCTFSEFIISQYNGCVQMDQAHENPWVVHNVKGMQAILSSLEKNIGFDSTRRVFNLPYESDRYTYIWDKEHVSSKEDVLLDIIKECLATPRVLIVYDREKSYFYYPDKDTTTEFPRLVSWFQEHACFFSFNLEWGWFVDKEGKIIFFGEKLRKMVEKESERIGIEKS